MSNVITLPRPANARPGPERFGLYLRVGHNQHRERADVLSSGECDFHGIVIDATNVERHKDLIDRALHMGLDAALDPKTHAMALPGGFSHSMSKLPWGGESHSGLVQFVGRAGKDIAQRIAQFTVDHGFTQVLAPTHILSGRNDRWIKCDVENASHLRNALLERGSDAEVVYPLALPMQVFRNPVERRAIINQVQDVPCDAVWLRVENFGADSTGDKTTAYIEGSRELQTIGKPIIADHAGGVAGLGLLAFGAVGGLAHGITLLEGFKAAQWRRPPNPEGRKGSAFTRIYIPKLDLYLKRDDAEAFFKSSTRTRGRYACRDSHCCAGGMRDMLSNPARHFVHQRSNEILTLSGQPDSLRPGLYLDQTVRSVSDDIASAAALSSIDDGLRKKLQKKQLSMSRFRLAMTHFAEVETSVVNVRRPAPRVERSKLG